MNSLRQGYARLAGMLRLNIVFFFLIFFGTLSAAFIWREMFFNCMPFVMCLAFSGITYLVHLGIDGRSQIGEAIMGVFVFLDTPHGDDGKGGLGYFFLTFALAALLLMWQIIHSFLTFLFGDYVALAEKLIATLG